MFKVTYKENNKCVNQTQIVSKVDLSWSIRKPLGQRTASQSLKDSEGLQSRDQYTQGWQYYSLECFIHLLCTVSLEDFINLCQYFKTTGVNTLRESTLTRPIELSLI